MGSCVMYIYLLLLSSVSYSILEMRLRVLSVAVGMNDD